MSSDPLDETVRIPRMADCVLASNLPGQGIVVDIAGLTDRGRVRANNEDCFLAVEFGRHLHILGTSLTDEDASPFDQGGYGMVVADGVGGHAAGEVASRTAVSGLLRMVEMTPDWIMSMRDDHANQVMERMEQRFQHVADELGIMAELSPELSGMATTMTLAVSLGPELLIAHVGDSRAYLLRDGQLVRLTHDHSRAQVLADMGIIDVGDVATHPMRNVLTNCLGQGRRVEVDFRRFRLKDADRLLLCTDGLTDMVDETQIQVTLVAGVDSAAVCRALVAQALDRGGADNVTVLVARYTIASLDG
jgi:protein phosphatase